ncbi:unnamed protein product, partial [Pylaiella littoralis]
MEHLSVVDRALPMSPSCEKERKLGQSSMRTEEKSYSIHAAEKKSQHHTYSSSRREPGALFVFLRCKRVLLPPCIALLLLLILRLLAHRQNLARGHKKYSSKDKATCCSMYKQ